MNGAWIIILFSFSVVSSDIYIQNVGWDMIYTVYYGGTLFELCGLVMLVWCLSHRVASMRLAYQELKIDRKKEEKKLQNLEGKKREQAERLGMGLVSRR